MLLGLHFFIRDFFAKVYLPQVLGTILETGTMTIVKLKEETDYHT
jgi:hypothetical protein